MLVLIHARALILGESNLVFLIPVSSAICPTLQALRIARILQSVEPDLNLLMERIGS
jgi:hypothetical protein